jgi:hypothetical protein
VRQWCADADWDTSASPDVDLVVDVTGGWPALLEHCRPNQGPLLQARVQELAVNAAADASKPLGAAFGLDLPAGRALKPLAVLGEASESSIVELLEQPRQQLVHPVDPAEEAPEALGGRLVRRSLQWARLLHLVRPLGGDRWRLDPTCRRLLRGQ